jgi:hypothetical protein
MITLPMRPRLLATSICALGATAGMLQAQTNRSQIVDLSQVPQIHETIE